jgi:hypothetical protein
VVRVVPARRISSLAVRLASPRLSPKLPESPRIVWLFRIFRVAYAREPDSPIPQFADFAECLRARAIQLLSFLPRSPLEFSSFRAGLRARASQHVSTSWVLQFGEVFGSRGAGAKFSTPDAGISAQSANSTDLLAGCWRGILVDSTARERGRGDDDPAGSEVRAGLRDAGVDVDTHCVPCSECSDRRSGRLIRRSPPG